MVLRNWLTTRNKKRQPYGLPFLVRRMLNDLHFVAPQSTHDFDSTLRRIVSANKYEKMLQDMAAHVPITATESPTVNRDDRMADDKV